MTLVCAQRHREYYGPIQGSGKKPYIITMFRDNELPTCTCTGFMTKRNKNANIIGGGYAGAGTGKAKQTAAWCKHLELIKDETCDWESKPGEKQLQCPKCGGPVVDKTAKRLPAGRGKGGFAGLVAANANALVRKTAPGKPLSSGMKKAAPKKLPKPDDLMAMAKELAGDVDTTPEPPKSRAAKTFEQITGKKAKPEVAVTIDTTGVTKPAKDAAAAASALAQLLERA